MVFTLHYVYIMYYIVYVCNISMYMCKYEEEKDEFIYAIILLNNNLVLIEQVGTIIEL